MQCIAGPRPKRVGFVQVGWNRSRFWLWRKNIIRRIRRQLISNMTPAIDALRAASVKFDVRAYTHDPNSRSYGLEAAEKLGLPPRQVFKSLVVELEGGGLCMGIIPVSQQLNLKRLAKSAGAKRATMAPAKTVERATGYVMGGVSPFGLKRTVRAFIDTSATNYNSVFVSGGKRGLDLEISPHDLLVVTNGCLADLT
ncbi:MAG: Cys-tRNA(Pro)/Cys-tRNA(Cys) deacylase [Gammaproteobacteria bacterium]|jgi:Cys-tRNA(Pro)/Cys-tRNA(Cys) deacylase